MRFAFSLFVLLLVTGYSSAGLLQRLQQIGRRTVSPSKKAEIPVLGGKKANETSATSVATPVIQEIKKEETEKDEVKPVVAEQDICGESVLIDLNSSSEQTFVSKKFPSGRKDPYACLWNIKVSKTCKRGQVTLKFNENSRLEKETRCARGYVRVTPILADTKVCGNVSALPPLRWIVDSEEQRREGINILMKNIGINDGNPEGVSFTLSGECLPDAAKSNLAPLNAGIVASWMSAASKRSGIVVYSRTMRSGKESSAVDIDDIIKTEEAMNDEEEAEVTTKKSTTTTTAKSVAKKTASTNEPNKKSEAELSDKPQKTYVPLGFLLLRRFIVPSAPKATDE